MPKMKSMQMENRLFFPIVIEEIKKGHTVTINLRGNSMRPFLESQRDKAMLTSPKNLKVGEYKIKTVCNGLKNSNKIIVKK